MKEFGSLAQFAAHLGTLEVSIVAEVRRGLTEVAKAVEKTARAEIGNYQPAVGPFPAWAPLADSTKKDRVRKGYTEDDPLLRSGDLRDSIGHEVGVTDAVIGSTSDIGVYQEMGTDKIPPRPFLGPAALRNEEEIQRILGRAAVRGLLAGAVLPAGLGYDKDV
ncbi:phage virion morphogenesis protein [Cupriavidus metallidurans]|uniref:phage virion morphogenesis protein n=1 Tax=Cupriavidus metallidurans TaxID=119219 RepID=UPI000CE04508|nr:phage virion morphogenesis protein [Cupriavidus metallidurans]AVA33367.1 hypothetical protein C3Z06_06825 [Cupriavidus metallidurans]